MTRARTALWAVASVLVSVAPSAFGTERALGRHALMTRHSEAPPNPDRDRPKEHGKRATSHPAGDDEDEVVQFVEHEPDEEKSPSKDKSTASHDKGHAHEAKHAKHRKRRSIRKDPPHALWAKYRREPWRRGYVSVVGHGKHWSGYLVDAEGDVPPLARKGLSAALASWRTGKMMLIDERLLGLVADISDEFGGRPIRIVSGYREQSWAPGSKHKVGEAFDFSIPGVPNEVLKDYLRSLPDVGVGYYPNSTHVHLDVREKPTYWVDYSAPGARPDYAYNRRVAGFTPRERELAKALDALGSEFENKPRKAAGQGGVPMMRTEAAVPEE